MHVIVLTHGRAAGTTLRHLEHWRREGGRTFEFISPIDDPFNIAGYPCQKIGNSSHHGSGCHARMYLAVLMAEQHGHSERVMLTEYDALFWREFLDFAEGDMEMTTGFIFKSEDRHFVAPTFTHWPVIANGYTWGKIADQMGACYEDGMTDRLLALAAQLARVKMLERSTFSANVIDGADRGRAIQHRKAGTLHAVHGVKDLSTYLALDGAK